MKYQESLKEKEKTVVILEPLKDLREIIDEYCGIECARLFDEVIEVEKKSIEEQYETNVDDYILMLNRQLLDTMDELEEILSTKRIDRKRLEWLYQKLYNNL